MSKEEKNVENSEGEAEEGESTKKRFKTEATFFVGRRGEIDIPAIEEEKPKFKVSLKVNAQGATKLEHKFKAKLKQETIDWDVEGTSKEKDAVIQTDMTCASSVEEEEDELPGLQIPRREVAMQTVFTYDADKSDTGILEELKSAIPVLDSQVPFVKQEPIPIEMAPTQIQEEFYGNQEVAVPVVPFDVQEAPADEEEEAEKYSSEHVAQGAAPTEDTAEIPYGSDISDRGVITELRPEITNIRDALPDATGFEQQTWNGDNIPPESVQADSSHTHIIREQPSSPTEQEAEIEQGASIGSDKQDGLFAVELMPFSPTDMLMSRSDAVTEDMTSQPQVQFTKKEEDFVPADTASLLSDERGLMLDTDLLVKPQDLQQFMEGLEPVLDASDVKSVGRAVSVELTPMLDTDLSVERQMTEQSPVALEPPAAVQDMAVLNAVSTPCPEITRKLNGTIPGPVEQKDMPERELRNMLKGQYAMVNIRTAMMSDGQDKTGYAMMSWVGGGQTQVEIIVQKLTPASTNVMIEAWTPALAPRETSSEVSSVAETSEFIPVSEMTEAEFGTYQDQTTDEVFRVDITDETLGNKTVGVQTDIALGDRLTSTSISSIPQEEQDQIIVKSESSAFIPSVHVYDQQMNETEEPAYQDLTAETVSTDEYAEEQVITDDFNDEVHAFPLYSASNDIIMKSHQNNAIDINENVEDLFSHFVVPWKEEARRAVSAEDIPMWDFDLLAKPKEVKLQYMYTFEPLTYFLSSELPVAVEEEEEFRATIPPEFRTGLPQILTGWSAELQEEEEEEDQTDVPMPDWPLLDESAEVHDYYLPPGPAISQLSTLSGILPKKSPALIQMPIHSEAWGFPFAREERYGITGDLYATSQISGFDIISSVLSFNNPNNGSQISTLFIPMGHADSSYKTGNSYNIEPLTHQHFGVKERNIAVTEVPGQSKDSPVAITVKMNPTAPESRIKVEVAEELKIAPKFTLQYEDAMEITEKDRHSVGYALQFNSSLVPSTEELKIEPIQTELVIKASHALPVTTLLGVSMQESDIEINKSLAVFQPGGLGGQLSPPNTVPQSADVTNLNIHFEPYSNEMLSSQTLVIQSTNSGLRTSLNMTFEEIPAAWETTKPETEGEVNYSINVNDKVIDEGAPTVLGPNNSALSFAIPLGTRGKGLVKICTLTSHHSLFVTPEIKPFSGEEIHAISSEIVYKVTVNGTEEVTSRKQVLPGGSPLRIRIPLVFDSDDLIISALDSGIIMDVVCQIWRNGIQEYETRQEFGSSTPMKLEIPVDEKTTCFLTITGNLTAENFMTKKAIVSYQIEGDRVQERTFTKELVSGGSALRFDVPYDSKFLSLSTYILPTPLRRKDIKFQMWKNGIKLYETSEMYDMTSPLKLKFPIDKTTYGILTLTGNLNLENYKDRNNIIVSKVVREGAEDIIFSKSVDLNTPNLTLNVPICDNKLCGRSTARPMKAELFFEVFFNGVKVYETSQALDNEIFEFPIDENRICSMTLAASLMSLNTGKGNTFAVCNININDMKQISFTRKIITTESKMKLHVPIFITEDMLTLNTLDENRDTEQRKIKYTIFKDDKELGTSYKELSSRGSPLTLQIPIATEDTEGTETEISCCIITNDGTCVKQTKALPVTGSPLRFDIPVSINTDMHLSMLVTTIRVQSSHKPEQIIDERTKMIDQNLGIDRNQTVVFSSEPEWVENLPVPESELGRIGIPCAAYVTDNLEEEAVDDAQFYDKENAMSAKPQEPKAPFGTVSQFAGSQAYPYFHRGYPAPFVMSIPFSDLTVSTEKDGKPPFKVLQVRSSSFKVQIAVDSNNKEDLVMSTALHITNSACQSSLSEKASKDPCEVQGTTLIPCTCLQSEPTLVDQAKENHLEYDQLAVTLTMISKELERRQQQIEYLQKQKEQEISAFEKKIISNFGFNSCKCNSASTHSPGLQKFEMGSKHLKHNPSYKTNTKISTVAYHVKPNTFIQQGYDQKRYDIGKSAHIYNKIINGVPLEFSKQPELQPRIPSNLKLQFEPEAFFDIASQFAGSQAFPYFHQGYPAPIEMYIPFSDDNYNRMDPERMSTISSLHPLQNYYETNLNQIVNGTEEFARAQTEAQSCVGTNTNNVRPTEMNISKAFYENSPFTSERYPPPVRMDLHMENQLRQAGHLVTDPIAGMGHHMTTKRNKAGVLDGDILQKPVTDRMVPHYQSPVNQIIPGNVPTLEARMHTYPSEISASIVTPITAPNSQEEQVRPQVYDYLSNFETWCSDGTEVSSDQILNDELLSSTDLENADEETNFYIIPS